MSFVGWTLLFLWMLYYAPHILAQVVFVAAMWGTILLARRTFRI